GGHALAHGEAVAIGVVFAAHLARDLGLIDEARVELHERIVGQEYGLLVRPPSGQRTATLIEFMKRDKKAIDGVTFVLDGPDGVETVVGVDPEVLAASFDAVR
ncbi:MAG: 3-dehydroquinate synthase, partial [Actinobacteria bacterium]|nr:3-dehydroquinate synthase [Actinomycetota bacterium]